LHTRDLSMIHEVLCTCIFLAIFLVHLRVHWVEWLVLLQPQRGVWCKGEKGGLDPTSADMYPSAWPFDRSKISVVLCVKSSIYSSIMSLWDLGWKYWPYFSFNLRIGDFGWREGLEIWLNSKYCQSWHSNILHQSMLHCKTSCMEAYSTLLISRSICHSCTYIVDPITGLGGDFKNRRGACIAYPVEY